MPLIGLPIRAKLLCEIDKNGGMPTLQKCGTKSDVKADGKTGVSI